MKYSIYAHKLHLQVITAEYGQRLAAINNLLEFSNQSFKRLRIEFLTSQEQEQCLRRSNRQHELVEELDTVYKK